MNLHPTKEARQEVYRLVQEEGDRIDEQFGVQSHSVFKWLAILGEEVGESNEAALEGWEEALDKELIQVASVAIAMVAARKYPEGTIPKSSEE